MQPADDRDAAATDGPGGPGAEDVDADGIPDDRDLDADGDGIPNRLESAIGLDPQGDADRDGVPNYRDADDRGDGTRNACADNLPPTGTCDQVAPQWDADADGTPNHLDLDADGDFVDDFIESGLGVDRDGDGRMDCAGGVGANGLCDVLERPADSGTVVWAGGLPDHDRDGVADFLAGDYQQRHLLPTERLVEPGNGTSGLVSPGSILGVEFRNAAAPIQLVDLMFEDVTAEAGLSFRQAPYPVAEKELVLSGGAAAADVDADGDLDIVFPRIDGVRLPSGGLVGPVPPAPTALVFLNDGRGRFTSTPLDLRTQAATSALLIDQDGDARLDLVVPSLHQAETALLLNKPGKTPLEYAPREIPVLSRSYSASAADYDGDGRLDVFLTHGPLAVVRRESFLLRNVGSAGFKDATEDAVVPNIDRALTALWGDVDHDGWPDLLVTADQRRSTILLNRLGVFQRAAAELTDENATGQVLADLDNDGDLDWFVSGIWVEKRSQLPEDLLEEGEIAISGNRLMRNEGGGHFVDTTDAAGVRGGWWGWAACAADLDNDGYQDLVQVNGYPKGVFATDPTKVWLNRGVRGFVDAAVTVGLKDEAQGRGVLCADFDGDGDVDVVTINYEGPPALWRNSAAAKRNWLALDLVGRSPNSFAVGAKVVVKSAGLTQYREIQAGSSYATQQPYRQHFGLGADPEAKVTVIWPDRTRSEHTLVPNKVHVLRAPR